MARYQKKKEDDSRSSKLVQFSQDIFCLMIGVITKTALKMMDDEWKRMRFSVSLGEFDDIDDLCNNPHCIHDCELPTRYGLPCMCFMVKAYYEKIPLPLSLVHPRWLIDGPIGVEFVVK